MKDDAAYRILVVDDYPDIADTSCLLLTALGHTCKTALGGIVALELIEDFDPDIVILDIGLPDLSGFEVARILRAHASRAYLAAMTCWAAPGDREDAYEAGFDLYMMKPATMTKLCNIVDFAVRARTRVASD